MSMADIVGSIVSFVKKPLFLILIAGLVLRFVLMPLFAYEYDIYHWALIASNIDSGNGLYELDGYYYTPVWGYILGFMSFFQELMVDIGELGIRFVEMLPIETLKHPYHIATITSIAFNVSIKIPLIIIDVIVGYLIYYLVKERTGNPKKGMWGFALWFLCPIVIYMSSVQGMFDNISALLLLLTVIMLYKDKCFIGGMFFSLAVLLKFFPAFCIFVLLAYIIVKHKDDGLAKKKVLEAMAGFLIMTAVIMLPTILDGNLEIAFSFIFGRAGSSDTITAAITLFNTGIALLAAFYFGYRMYRTPARNADSSMFTYVLLTITASVLSSVAPQYVIVVMPFLILYILTMERSYIRCWVMLGMSAFLGAFFLNNYSLFASLVEYASFMSPEWLISSMQMLENSIFGINLIQVFAILANCLQYISLLLIFMFYFAESIYQRFPRIGRIMLRFKGKEAVRES